MYVHTYGFLYYCIHTIHKRNCTDLKFWYTQKIIKIHKTDLRYEFAVFRSWKWAVAWSRVMPVRSELFLSGWYCKANILKAVFTSISVASSPSPSTPNESKRFRPTPSGSHCLLVGSSSLLALGGGRLPVLPCRGPDCSRPWPGELD